MKGHDTQIIIKDGLVSIIVRRGRLRSVDLRLIGLVGVALLAAVEHSFLCLEVHNLTLSFNNMRPRNAQSEPSRPEVLLQTEVDGAS